MSWLGLGSVQGREGKDSREGTALGTAPAHQEWGQQSLGGGNFRMFWGWVEDVELSLLSSSSGRAVQSRFNEIEPQDLLRAGRGGDPVTQILCSAEGTCHHPRVPVTPPSRVVALGSDSGSVARGHSHPGVALVTKLRPGSGLG